MWSGSPGYMFVNWDENTGNYVGNLNDVTDNGISWYGTTYLTDTVTSNVSVTMTDDGNGNLTCQNTSQALTVCSGTYQDYTYYYLVGTGNFYYTTGGYIFSTYYGLSPSPASCTTSISEGGIGQAWINSITSNYTYATGTGSPPTAGTIQYDNGNVYVGNGTTWIQL
jgi:hypothetical protein